MMVSPRTLECLRLTLCSLSVLGIIAHVTGLVGYFQFKYNMFGITLIHYPHAKAILEGLGIFASVLLGVGAVMSQRNLVFIYIVIGGLYLMAHLVCSTVMLKFMVKYLGAGVGEMKGFLITTFGTYVLLLLTLGSASFYVTQNDESESDEENQTGIEDTRESVAVAGPSTLRAFRITEMKLDHVPGKSHEMIEIVE